MGGRFASYPLTPMRHAPQPFSPKRGKGSGDLVGKTLNSVACFYDTLRDPFLVSWELNRGILHVGDRHP